jgi:hypothetical protein
MIRRILGGAKTGYGLGSGQVAPQSPGLYLDTGSMETQVLSFFYNDKSSAGAGLLYWWVKLLRWKLIHKNLWIISYKVPFIQYCCFVCLHIIKSAILDD